MQTRIKAGRFSWKFLVLFRIGRCQKTDCGAIFVKKGEKMPGMRRHCG